MFENLKYNLKHNRRSAMKNITAWVIFSAIILVFVFWGMTPQDRGVTQGGSAATVNEATISMAQLMDVMERMQRDPRFEQLKAMGGDAGRQFLQNQALSQLVELELVRQATDREKVFTTDAEVRDIITGIPQFQEEGRFKRELYLGYLSATRKSAGSFEDEIRREQSLSRTVRVFGAALKPLKLEAAKTRELERMKADLDYVSVPTESLVIPESIPKADVTAFMAQADTAAKVKSYFESHKQDFSQPEKVKARHILIRIKPGDAESEKAAKAKVEDLLKKAKAGGDFAKLASQFSEDPGSKAKGGLLDFFSRGKMVPEFENAAFSLKVGEISEPVKTEYGFHLIQALEKKPASNRGLEDVDDEIAATLLSRDRSRAAVDALQESLKKGDVAAVNAFVASHKLKWDTTGPFAINADAIPKIGGNDEVLRVAFQLSPEKPLAENLIREGAQALVLRYKAAPVAAEKKDEKKIDSNRDLMSEMMASRRGEDSLRKWVDSLRKSAKISTNNQLGRPVTSDINDAPSF